MQFVDINYNLSDYLPDNAPSTAALNEYKNSFQDSIPNLKVYIPDVSIPEALAYKERLKGINGVDSVLWLDDIADVYMPLEMQDTDTVEAWYTDESALFVLSVNENSYADTIQEITKIVGEKALMSGEALNQATIQTRTMDEVSMIMLYALPLVLIILLISTSSWFEPVLFLITIGVAILMNEGTNVFLREISFVTRATSAILQLAVSIDYAVFLLHSFARYRDKGIDVKESMKKAMVESSSAIAASAATTMFGFLALVLMKFKIGPDMGIVLVKGVLCSYLSVIVMMPVLTLYTTKVMDKTRHRKLLPSFKGFGRFSVRICIPLAVFVFILIIPGFLGQQRNEFVYGSSAMHSTDSKLRKDAEFIDSIFGGSQQMVLIVPEGNIANETALTKEIEKITGIVSVISYSGTVGRQIPQEILTEDQLSEFRSNKYGRIIIYAKTPEEGEEAFNVVEAIRDAASRYYENTYYLLGQTVVNYDLKNTITGDYLPVTLASVLAIGLVLLVTFRSVSIPLILLLTIEGAVWINLSIPYFTGNSLNYIGYQIISSVQLGATVDYGILFTQRYLENRKITKKHEAAKLAVSETAASILTPAGILTIAGATLGVVSSNGIISQLGMILGRGAAVSAAMVLFFLPALLIIFDGLIQKTFFRRKNPAQV